MQEPVQPQAGRRILSQDVIELCNPSDGPTVEVIFIHGIQLGEGVGEEEAKKLYLTTWMKRDSTTECWPETFFKNDDHLTNSGIKVRALTVRYDASKFKTDREGRLDMYLISESFLSSIVMNRRVNMGMTENVPVILVAHSFGGLLVKEFLIHAARKVRRNEIGGRAVKKFLDNLIGVFFYSTPHLALKKEVFEKLFPGGESQYNDLVTVLKELNQVVGRLEETIQDLKRSTAFGKNYGGIEFMEVFEMQETDLGFWKGQILEEGSGRGAANQARFVDADHFTVCRPADTTDVQYQTLANFIEEQWIARLDGAGNAMEVDSRSG